MVLLVPLGFQRVYKYANVQWENMRTVRFLSPHTPRGSVDLFITFCEGVSCFVLLSVFPQKMSLSSTLSLHSPSPTYIYMQTDFPLSLFFFFFNLSKPLITHAHIHTHTSLLNTACPLGACFNTLSVFESQAVSKLPPALTFYFPLQTAHIGCFALTTIGLRSI